jgi:hypothetical protein
LVRPGEIPLSRPVGEREQRGATSSANWPNSSPQLRPEEYHVAYFFVFDPQAAEGQGSVLKVEAPRLVLSRHDPEELQLAVPE